MCPARQSGHSIGVLVLHEQQIRGWVIGPGARGPMHCRPRSGAGRRRAAIGELVTPEYDGLPVPP